MLIVAVNYNSNEDCFPQGASIKFSYNKQLVSILS